MSGSEVTFVNVLDIADGKIEEVSKILTEAADKVISKRNGFKGLKLYASKDGKRIINVAKWATVEDVQAAGQDPEAGKYMKQLAGIATPAPGVFDEVASF